MKWVLAALIAVLFVATAVAQQIESSKLNSYAVSNGATVSGSKLVAYAVISTLPANPALVRSSPYTHP